VRAHLGFTSFRQIYLLTNFVRLDGLFDLLEKRDVMETKRPKGELCKIQFNKSITVIGKVTFDQGTGKYHIHGIDSKSGREVNSWVDATNVSLIEDANMRETRRFETDRSKLKHPDE